MKGTPYGRERMPAVDPYSLPLDEINVADPDLFATNSFWPYFERLRKECPVHYFPNKDDVMSGPEGGIGAFWSVTKFEDIMYVETHPEIFSSEPAITLFTPAEDFPLPMFIAMDPPKHDEQRKTVQPIVSGPNLAALESTIRERVCLILDDLPRGETFNWVDRVSVELTTQMLATLFDFPWEERRKLTFWSDAATTPPDEIHERFPLSAVPEGLTARDVRDELDGLEWRRHVLRELGEYFVNLWNQRVNQPPKNDLVSMLAHGEATKNMDFFEYLGNVILLIVGGNDTTRNSLSGGVLALNQNPDEYDKLRADPRLVTSMVPEIIRWQTPLAYMRRTAKQDTEIRGQKIKQGDKVCMWYVSGNRDEDAIDRANEFIIDRERPRHHLSFGFGIHRCVGNRLAEMQLRIVWEEIMKRFHTIEVMGEPQRVHSSFVKGYHTLPVRIRG